MGPDMHFFPEPGEAPLAYAPIAYMAFSPQGPGSEGFEDTSFDAIQAAPILTATGSGDDAGGEHPLVRREAHYHMMPAGDRYQLYVCDTRFEHGTTRSRGPAPRASMNCSSARRSPTSMRACASGVGGDRLARLAERGGEGARQRGVERPLSDVRFDCA